ncbi:MAG TPA: hypothetical protein VMW31_04365 [Devosiaceae bacterium]|nr:hypothetical protein [Devosiaceae bacterium]
MPVTLMTTVAKVDELKREEEAIVADVRQHELRDEEAPKIAGTPLEVTQHVFESRKVALLSELDARDRLVTNLRDQRDELNKRIAAEMAMRQRAHTALEVLENALASLKNVVAASVDELFSRAYARERLATEDTLVPETEATPRLRVRGRAKKAVNNDNKKGTLADIEPEDEDEDIDEDGDRDTGD